jgi:hypothetical protein
MIDNENSKLTLLPQFMSNATYQRVAANRPLGCSKPSSQLFKDIAPRVFCNFGDN